MKTLAVIPVLAVLAGCVDPLSYRETERRIEICHSFGLEERVYRVFGTKVYSVECEDTETGTVWTMGQLEGK